MNVIKTKNEISNLLQKQLNLSETIGLVPTMGALHVGHLSLIEEAYKQNDKVVVSIFVNPTQFDNSDDLERYPQNLDNDLKNLTNRFENLIVFTPNPNEIYGNNLKAESFDFGELAYKMEGASREGHFEGVGTVLKKLFEIIKPDKAFFGEKDYQQLLIVRKLVEILNLPIQIIGCPIKREENGLAMSSRNERLSELGKQRASLIFKSLSWAKKNFGIKDVTSIIAKVEEDFKTNPDFILDYFEITNAKTLDFVKDFEENKDYRALIAAQIEGVRLIDNMALN